MGLYAELLLLLYTVSSSGSAFDICVLLVIVSSLLSYIHITLDIQRNAVKTVLVVIAIVDNDTVWNTIIHAFIHLCEPLVADMAFVVCDVRAVNCWCMKYN